LSITSPFATLEAVTEGVVLVPCAETAVPSGVVG
jgi:hypothetical protein